MDVGNWIGAAALAWTVIGVLSGSVIGLVKKVWGHSTKIETLEKDNEQLKRNAEKMQEKIETFADLRTAIAVINALIPRFEKTIEKLEEKL